VTRMSRRRLIGPTRLMRLICLKRLDAV
jgi:hypothetical protein